MPDFPALRPYRRTYNFGEFPLATESDVAGGSVRFLHGDSAIRFGMSLTYEWLTQAEATLIRDHYRGQQGSHIGFALPDVIWAGHSSVANIVSEGQHWRYAGVPEESHISGGTLINVTVSLITAVCPPAGDPDLLVLLRFNGADGTNDFIDESGNDLSITPVGGATISTAQSKFGGSSGLFDGSNDRLDLPAGVTTTGRAYTAEAWVYPVVDFDFRGIFSGRGFGGPTLRTTPSGALQYLNVSLVTPITTSATLSLGSMQHVAMTNTDAGMTTIWINGIDSGSADQSALPTHTFSFVGYGGSPGEYWRGYIDEMRISNVCRYTANFMPPAAPFPGG